MLLFPASPPIPDKPNDRLLIPLNDAGFAEGNDIPPILKGNEERLLLFEAPGNPPRFIPVFDGAVETLPNISGVFTPLKQKLLLAPVMPPPPPPPLC